jgi:hypothetical protein
MFTAKKSQVETQKTHKTHDITPFISTLQQLFRVLSVRISERQQLFVLSSIAVLSSR